jgi:hypothetical protein
MRAYCFPVVALFAALLLHAFPRTLEPPSTVGANGECKVQVAGFRVECQRGWNIVDEDKHAVTGAISVTLGDFVREKDTRHLTRPKGRATIKVSSMGRLYRNLDEWVHAGTKLVPEAIRSKVHFSNRSAGMVEATCLTPPETERDFFFASYFFELKGTPLNVELVHHPDSQKAAEYREAVKQLIERLQPN